MGPWRCGLRVTRSLPVPLLLFQGPNQAAGEAVPRGRRPARCPWSPRWEARRCPCPGCPSPAPGSGVTRLRGSHVSCVEHGVGVGWQPLKHPRLLSSIACVGSAQGVPSAVRVSTVTTCGENLLCNKSVLQWKFNCSSGYKN